MTNTSGSEQDETKAAPSAPAGWYDDGSGRQRWFDGAQWTDTFAPSVPASPPATPAPAAEAAAVAEAAQQQATPRVYQVGEIVNGHQLVSQPDGSVEWVPMVVAAGVGGGAPTPKKSRRALWITLGSVAGLLVLVGVINGIARPSNTTPSTLVGGSSTKSATPSPAAEVEMVEVPTGLVGMTASDAAAALEAVGLEAKYDGEPTAKVLSIAPTAVKLAVGTVVTLTVEQPPALTLSQKNAIRSAESYLSFMHFSRSGLIGQLEYEGYSTEDASFAVDYISPDWYAQAAGSAQSYMDTMAFSRDGLYDQLIYEGFSPDEANAGLAAVGY